MISFAQVIVERGGELIIDGGKLTTSCVNLWKGIIVQGDWGIIVGDESIDPGPGKLIVKNNSVIEYAETAIVSNQNGVVKITDSEFINCPIGVDLANYNETYLEWSAYPTLKPRAYIHRSTFETNDDYKISPNTHVKLFDVDKIYLKGNTFKNTTSNELPGGEIRGNGIYSINSGLRVIENRHFYGTPNSPWSPSDKSLFEGLYYGIYAENTSPKTTIIRNCDFVEYEKIGAYLKTFDLPIITTNTFTSNVLGEIAGLYLQNCGGYHVENNTFNDWAYGLIVKSSSTESNEIYRNTFNNNSYSLNSYYSNASSTGYQGLFMRCNDFNQENIHFDANIFVAKGEVKKHQGLLSLTPDIPSISAANQFDISELSGEKAFKTFNTYFDYKYYFNQVGDFTDITGFTSSNVETAPTFLTFTQDETCPSKLPQRISIVSSEHIAIKNATIDSENDDLNGLVDGGNTAVVLSKVQNLTPNKFNITCKELIEYSPYLSDTVLTTFMQTNVNGHVVAKTNVLLANSPLPENAFAELENMNLPDPHKSIIYQNQVGTNAVLLKEEAIGQLVFEKDLLTNEFLRYRFQNDTIPGLSDEAIDFLLIDNTPGSKTLVIPILVTDKKYPEAIEQIELLESEIINYKYLNKEEYIDFIELQKIAINVDTLLDTDDYVEIVQNNLNFIEGIAYNQNHMCSSQAQTLLTIAGLAEFEPEFIIPLEDRSLKISKQEESTYQAFDLNNLIEVYPTPASTVIWIEYLMLNDKSVGKIEIFDISGKLVLTQPIRNGFGVEQVNVSNLREGNYLLKLGEFTKQISLVK